MPRHRPPHPASSSPERPPVPGRRERRRSETRERIFRAALRLFAEKGFGDTTVEDITNAADLGKGTFFNYFPSKEHILIGFSDMQLGKLREQVMLAQQTKESMPQILQRLSVRMTEEPGRNPEIVRLILLANLTREPVRAAMRERLAEARRLLRDLICLGQERGEIRADCPAEEIARSFFHLVFGTLMMWTLHQDAPLKVRMDSTLEFLWRGLASPGPAARGSEP